ncbi:glucose 1-dehydrogenase [Actinomadura sp. LD22]|uniref:Glucose 1-dehydrogenase n=1 Tax=Actinomadura physcomitrii TaxID=2650748 RepID=A0A6I4MKJ3_9ACTN|nr:glucose 1-dehydrogenase [Actinomadura physcomitrii]MWA03229.1 glucose 1-dehydrogenase [Actinomadura physcomitrii]
MGTALVTGAGRGIGRAIARRLAADGFSVVIAELDPDTARDAAKEVGGRAVRCDVTDEAAIDAMAGSLDDLQVLVNNAGIYPFGKLADISTDEFRRVLEVNVVAPLLLSRRLLPLLAASPSGGAVVNIASLAAKAATPGTGAYSPSKAALVSLTKLCALEFADSGVRFNAVAPGGVRTEGTAGVSADAEREARFNALVPLGRRALPDDIADVVSFFASPDSRYITGQVLYVDGGLSEATIPFLQAAQRGA